MDMRIHSQSDGQSRESKLDWEWLNAVLGGAFLVAGTCIGAGMLGLPIQTAAGGFFPSIGLFAVIWVMMTFTALVMLEVALSCQGETNLITMATRTLGRWGGRIAWSSYLLFLYSVMAAYTAGGTTMLADLSGVPVSHHSPWVLTAMLVFAFPFALMVYLGTRWVAVVNRYMIIVLIVAFGSIIYLMKNIHAGGIIEANTHPKYLLAALSLLVTSFGFHLLIPTLKTFLKENVTQLRLAIIIGSLIPFLVYLVWEYIAITHIPTWGDDGLIAMLFSQKNPGELFLDVMGHQPGLQFAIALFSLMALSSSFVGVALGISDFFADGLHIKKTPSGKVLLGSLTFLPPLLYTFFIPDGFMLALSYAGIFASILLLVYPALMAWSSRYIRKDPCCYKVSGGKTGLVVAFIFGFGVILLEIANQLNFLPMPKLH
ncbi:MAG: aromatic amino acid transport family protein [Desulfatirhabdiaceae bacterium]